MWGRGGRGRGGEGKGTSGQEVRGCGSMYSKKKKASKSKDGGCVRGLSEAGCPLAGAGGWVGGAGCVARGGFVAVRRSGSLSRGGSVCLGVVLSRGGAVSLSLSRSASVNWLARGRRAPPHVSVIHRLVHPHCYDTYEMITYTRTRANCWLYTHTANNKRSVFQEFEE